MSLASVGMLVAGSTGAGDVFSTLCNVSWAASNSAKAVPLANSAEVLNASRVALAVSCPTSTEPPR